MNNKVKTWTVREMSEQLGVCYRIGLQLVKNGSVPAVKVGDVWKIPKPAFTKYLENAGACSCQGGEKEMAIRQGK